LREGKRGLRSIFPTVLMERRLDDIAPHNERIREIVLEREAREAGVTASNVGGWHSSADLMDWDFPEIQQLCEAFLLAGQDMTAAMLPAGMTGRVKVRFHGGVWANVLRDGGYNRIHNHPGSVWSGCYYVSVGRATAEPAHNGWIEFQDPRPGNIHGGKEPVEPREGTILIFPGWLNHFVNPFRGEGERISIAFNLDAEFVPDGVA
jgi:uncharacterized protein (TIGR02466 family)